ncbi:7912_t:CDS:2 [Acaulospora morrowiae]|uniref:7912_t:CDS:1 n=1 Tax=Acaulospora morrowiae TaxID=94023 RepID=A0A9N8YX34_9GLOM|nr:7912_t:CDS:2 [Acaulospora morrowiae]
MTTQLAALAIHRNFKLLHSYITFAMFIGVAIKCLHLVPLRSYLNGDPNHSFLVILISAVHMFINQWYMYIFLRPSFESFLLLLNAGNFPYDYKKFRNESASWILKGTVVPYELNMLHKDSSISTCTLHTLIKSFNVFWWFAILSVILHLFMIALSTLLNYLPDHNVTLRICKLADDKQPVSLGDEKFDENTRGRGWGICSGDERRLRVNINEFRNSCINVIIDSSSNDSYIVDIYGYSNDMSASEDSGESKESSV